MTAGSSCARSFHNISTGLRRSAAARRVQHRCRNECWDRSLQRAGYSQNAWAGYTLHDEESMNPDEKQGDILDRATFRVFVVSVQPSWIIVHILAVLQGFGLLCKVNITISASHLM